MTRKILQIIYKFFGITIQKYNKEYEESRIKFLLYSSLYKKLQNFTMIPVYTFIDNLRLAEKIKSLDGDIVECGVWRGGMIAAIGQVLGNKRKYWLYDSFEGLPEASDADGVDAIKWQENTNAPNYYDNCRAEEGYAIKAMQLVEIKNYEIVKGWFKDTLPYNKCEKIALLRMDGDWYDSTMICLNYLYSRVVDGGLIIIDDYYFWEGCSKAVHDFLSINKSSDTIHETKNGVCYIIKNEQIQRF